MKTKQTFYGQVVFKKYFQGGKLRNSFCLLLAALRSLTVLPVAWFVRHIFDRAIPNGHSSRLLFCSLAVMALYFLEGGLILWLRRLFLKNTKAAVKLIRDDLIKKIYSLPYSCIKKRDPMELHTAIIQDTQRLDIMINALAAQLIPAVLVCAGSGAVLFYLNSQLFFLITALLPLLFFLSKYSSRLLKQKISCYHDSFYGFSTRVAALLARMTLTRIQVMEKTEISAQEKIHRKLAETGMDQALAGAFSRIVQRTAIMFFGVMILLAGGWYVSCSRMTLGQLFAFIAVTNIFKNSLQEMVNVIPQIAEGRVAAKRLDRIFSAHTDPVYQGKKKISFPCKIVLDKVSFFHGEKRILHNISLTLLPGSITVLTGENGTGKTAIANLIAGFYHPAAGKILAADIPYSELDIAWLRQRTGFVHQDPIIMEGSVQENITYGHPDAKKHEIINALDSATATKWVNSLPEGLATRISGPGNGASAGELQKLAIARALLKNPGLLILDEPTSHFDRASVRDLTANLRDLSPMPAILLISHDPEVISLGNKILILSADGITAGSPSEISGSGIGTE